MREPTEGAGRLGSGAEITERMLASAGLGPLVAEAEEVWRTRAGTAEDGDGEAGLPRWRSFEDAFPTFYQFTNRPPR
jgi:hypothetical protein